MRCRKATKLIGPYIDGELTAPQAGELREHLETCDDCAQSYILMRSLVRDVSSLPAIVPTPEETYRLINRLRREVVAPAPPRTGTRRIQVAAAALSMLVVATVAGVTLAVWGGGGTTVVEEGGAEDRSVTLGEEEDQILEAQTFNFRSDSADTTAASLARPDVVVSSQEYDAADLEDYRNDLGARLDFYSAYWYPASSDIEPEAIAQMQEDFSGELAAQAAVEGQNPDELKLAVAAALEQTDDAPVLPCYAERAVVDDKDVWLVSVSGPEDYLLFPDQQRPSAMKLASLGGETSLKISESLLRELASVLAGQYGTKMPALPASTAKNQTELGLNDASEAPSAPGTGAGEATVEEDEEFQAFLRKLAARGTSLDLISALDGLNYEQLLELLHGDWAALAADGVNLSDFLVPPQRLYAVDCASGQVVWPPEY
ncbi:MAG: zf-HC2 domain-containing protein [Actinobacteria bacterium]|nr:zf-HC2 domain-containing protein [Actinomycetota bacterium]